MVQKFGKYRLLQRIAVGGMAEIFVARRSGMEGFRKTIVIKRIRPHLSEQESFIKMFLDEARLAAQLNHSNIAQIFDLGRIEDSFFIAMEYVYGKDMRGVIPKAEDVGIPFPLVYSLKIAASVCEGLYYAHRKSDEDGKPLNIVHRDVTPENIMVSFDGEVKILDFGIAKAETLTSNTRAGEIKGKLGYLSPEQVGGKILDHRSDLFSLGVVLYEWLTARKLFKGSSEIDVLRAVVEAKINPPSQIRESIPKEVDAIIMKILDRDRNKRYQTAWELQHDIYQFLSRQEFIPSNIHLSNFMRQLFADELSNKDQKTALQEEERTFSDDHETMLVTPAELTEQNTNKKMKRPKKQKSQASTQDLKNKPVLLEKSKVTEAHDPLQVEIMTSDNDRMSLAIDLEKITYARLSEIAQRNGMTVAEFVREVLSHYTKYL